MKQERFVALHGKDWDRLQSWLHALDRQPRRTLRQEQALDFPAEYRRVCHHLALARGRGYSHEVTERLQRLVQHGHRVLYRPPAPRWHRVAVFLLAGFPPQMSLILMAVIISILLVVQAPAVRKWMHARRLRTAST